MDRFKEAFCNVIEEMADSLEFFIGFGIFAAGFSVIGAIVWAVCRVLS
jgi:hypothetical protein